MKTFNSKTINLPVSKETVYHFLSDFNNFEKLMPPEVNRWQSDQHSCSFTISGIATLNMTFGASVPDQKIEIVSRGDNPFHYTLSVFIDELGAEQSSVKARFDADLNMMMAMVASPHLENFVHRLVEKLEEVFAGSAQR